MVDCLENAAAVVIAGLAIFFTMAFFVSIAIVITSPFWIVSLIVAKLVGLI